MSLLEAIVIRGSTLFKVCREVWIQTLLILTALYPFPLEKIYLSSSSSLSPPSYPGCTWIRPCVYSQYNWPPTSCRALTHSSSTPASTSSSSSSASSTVGGATDSATGLGSGVASAGASGVVSGATVVGFSSWEVKQVSVCKEQICEQRVACKCSHDPWRQAGEGRRPPGQLFSSSLMWRI